MSSQGTKHLRERVAANIDAAIKAAGFTNRELATRIDASETQVWRWRNGKHGISHEHLIALAAALDRDLAWFYMEDDDPKVAA